MQIEKFVEKDLSIIKWVALGASIIQVLSVLLACWLTSVQKAELEAAERYGIARKSSCVARQHLPSRELHIGLAYLKEL